MHVTLITGTPAAGEGRVRFDGGDPVFGGHFADAPVLPGVALIDAAVTLVSRAAQRALRLARVGSVKFRNVVRPGEEIAFTFKTEPGAGIPGALAVRGQWLRGTEKIADLAFVAVPQEACP